MFSNQLQSSSGLSKVMAGGKQKSSHLSLQREMPKQEGNTLLLFLTQNPTQNLCLGSSVGAKPLLDKLSVNAMCSTETVFLQKQKRIKRINTSMLQFVQLITYPCEKILFNLHFRITDQLK